MLLLSRDLIDSMVKVINLKQAFSGWVSIGCPGKLTLIRLSEIVFSCQAAKSRNFQPIPSDDPKQSQSSFELANEARKAA